MSMCVEYKVLKTLKNHGKQYTKPMFRMTQAKLDGYDVESFRCLLINLRDKGFIKYVPETKYSLAYWEIGDHA